MSAHHSQLMVQLFYMWKTTVLFLPPSCITEHVHGVPFNRLVNVLRAYKELHSRDVALFTAISDYVASSISMWNNKQVTYTILLYTMIYHTTVYYARIDHTTVYYNLPYYSILYYTIYTNTILLTPLATLFRVILPIFLFAIAYFNSCYIYRMHEDNVDIAKFH